jgi:hypothetical protein
MDAGSVSCHFWLRGYAIGLRPSHCATAGQKFVRRRDARLTTATVGCTGHKQRLRHRCHNFRLTLTTTGMQAGLWLARRPRHMCRSTNTAWRTSVRPTVEIS